MENVPFLTAFALFTSGTSIILFFVWAFFYFKDRAYRRHNSLFFERWVYNTVEDPERMRNFARATKITYEQMSMIFRYMGRKHSTFYDLNDVFPFKDYNESHTKHYDRIFYSWRVEQVVSWRDVETLRAHTRAMNSIAHTLCQDNRNKDREIKDLKTIVAMFRFVALSLSAISFLAMVLVILR